MTISGSQLANTSTGAGQGTSNSGSLTKAIKSVTGAASNADKTSGAKSKDGESTDEVAAVGQGEKKDLLTSGPSRLSAAIKGGVASLLPIASPAASMFGPRFNPLGSLFPSAFGGGASGKGWDGAAVANTNPFYNGDRVGPNGDPAGGGYMGSPNDHIFTGKEKPDNITFLGSSDSGSNAFGWNGTAIANAMSTRIQRGEALGVILNDLDGKPLQTGDKFQTPHLTSTGSGLTVSYNASKSNQVTGTGIILLGGDGTGEYRVGLDQGAQKIYDSMLAIGLTPHIVRSQEEMEALVKKADQDAKDSGGKQLLWLHVEAHGNSNDQSGGHNTNAIGGVSAGGKMIHENAVIAALAYGTGHTDKLGTTGSCHGGAIGANEFFDYMHQLDSTFRLQPSKKEESTAPDKAEELKQPDQRTGSVEPKTTEPEKTTLIAGADKTPEEKKREAEFLSIEIA